MALRRRESHQHENLDMFAAADSAEHGYWGEVRAYVLSLLKAWWGDAASEANDYTFGRLFA